MLFKFEQRLTLLHNVFFCSITANCLRALDGLVTLVSNDDESHQEIVTIATSMLSSPLPQQVQEQAKMLLASLHPTKMTYNNHKVCVTLFKCILYLTSSLTLMSSFILTSFSFI